MEMLIPSPVLDTLLQRIGAVCTPPHLDHTIIPSIIIDELKTYTVRNWRDGELSNGHALSTLALKALIRGKLRKDTVDELMFKVISNEPVDISQECERPLEPYSLIYETLIKTRSGVRRTFDCFRKQIGRLIGREEWPLPCRIMKTARGALRVPKFDTIKSDPCVMSFLLLGELERTEGRIVHIYILDHFCRVYIDGFSVVELSFPDGERHGTSWALIFARIALSPCTHHVYLLFGYSNSSPRNKTSAIGLYSLPNEFNSDLPREQYEDLNEKFERFIAQLDPVIPDDEWKATFVRGNRRIFSTFNGIFYDIFVGTALFPASTGHRIKFSDSNNDLECPQNEPKSLALLATKAFMEGMSKNDEMLALLLKVISAEPVDFFEIAERKWKPKKKKMKKPAFLRLIRDSMEKSVSFVEWMLRESQLEHVSFNRWQLNRHLLKIPKFDTLSSDPILMSEILMTSIKKRLGRVQIFVLKHFYRVIIDGRIVVESVYFRYLRERTFWPRLFFNGACLFFTDTIEIFVGEYPRDSLEYLKNCMDSMLRDVNSKVPAGGWEALFEKGNRAIYERSNFSITGAFFRHVRLRLATNFEEEQASRYCTFQF
ncbi:unnamed protein product [Caenorhabditis sp. 36 PRJEB53466]|nr:unnamed protein product [Caenorhabditis sp. 36 PRJEB53466]